MYHNYFVYITTNPSKKVLYIGVTNGLYIQIQQHYQSRGQTSNFTGKYFCYNLIYFEHYPYIDMAIECEKEIKKW